MTSCQNISGALISLNGRTRISNNLYFVKKMVLCICDGSIATWWYALLKLIFETTRALQIQSNISSIWEIKYASIFVFLFSILKLIHLWSVPSFLWTKMIGTPQGDTLSFIYLFARYPSNCLCTSANSFTLILYY